MYLEWSLSHTWFFNIISLRKLRSLSYTYLLNVDIFHYKIFLKITFIAILANSFNKKKRILSIGYKLSKTNFHLKTQMLLLTTNTHSCVSWGDRLTSSIFKVMSARYPNLNNYICLLVILSCKKKKGVSWKKVACSDFVICFFQISSFYARKNYWYCLKSRYLNIMFYLMIYLYSCFTTQNQNHLA